jgi:hypothetical protein
MDSRMPGTDSRCNVSWIACQSSNATKTAPLRLPVIKTGSCESAAWSIRRYKLARASLAVRTMVIEALFDIFDMVRYFVRFRNSFD